MKTVYNVLEVNEKDNLTTAFGKGMVEGAVKGMLIWGTIGMAVVLVGKMLPENKIEEIEEETAE